MARRRGRLQKLLCAVLPLALLAPLCLAFGASDGHYCACGMKKGECSCDLAMHRVKPGGGHCDKMMAAGSQCVLRGRRPAKSDVPRVTLDLRHRVGIFEFHGFGLRLDPLGAVEPAGAPLLLSLASRASAAPGLLPGLVKSAPRCAGPGLGAVPAG